MRPRILFDVTRLCWRARRGSPTGIDRVVLAYGRWLTARPDIDLVPVALAGGRLTRISSVRFRALMNQAAPAPPQTDTRWQALLQALTTPAGQGVGARLSLDAQPRTDVIAAGLDTAARWISGHLSPPIPADFYVNVAHTGLHRTELLAGLRRRGIKPVVMVHDLIPLSHPEFCTAQAAGKHWLRMMSVLNDASVVITNSQATADDFRAFAAAQDRDPPPIVAAPLGIEDAFVPTAPSASFPLPYFVCVGTLEGRKNLPFLLGLWRRLVEDLGEAAPRLVLVGRRGWENEAVIDQLDRADAVRRLVSEVADLHDTQLAALIGGAAGLLAPSFAEGFDLPLLEALSVGTPAIASDIAAHRELASAATLLDPLDGPGWISAIKAATHRSRPVSLPFTKPDWNSHFVRVAEAMGLERP